MNLTISDTPKLVLVGGTYSANGESRVSFERKTNLRFGKANLHRVKKSKEIKILRKIHISVKN